MLQFWDSNFLKNRKIRLSKVNGDGSKFEGSISHPLPELGPRGSTLKWSQSRAYTAPLSLYLSLSFSPHSLYFYAPVYIDDPLGERLLRDNELARESLIRAVGTD